MSSYLLGEIDHTTLIDPRTGKGGFVIPLARLFADEGMNNGFDIAITCKLHAPDLHLLRPGLAQLAADIDDGPDTFNQFRAWDLWLANGNCIDVYTPRSGKFQGNGFVVDATNEMDKAFNTQRDDSQIARQVIDGSFIIIYNKNGTCEVFEHVDMNEKTRLGDRGTPAGPPRGKGAVSKNIFLSRYVLPSGRELTFTWEHRDSIPRLCKITNDRGTLLEATWTRTGAVPTLAAVTLYTESSGITTVTCIHSDDLLKVEVTGGAKLGKTCYQMHKKDGAVSKIAVERHHIVSPAKSYTQFSTSTEAFTYTGKKVSEREISSDGGMDTIVETYTHEADKFEVISKVGEQTIGTRACKYKDGMLISETWSANGLTSSITQELNHDSKRNVMVQKTVRTSSAGVKEEVVLEYDEFGNLVRREEGDLVSKWTYFNNYQKYSVQEMSGAAYALALTTTSGLVYNPNAFNPHWEGYRPGLAAGLRDYTISTTFIAPSECNYAKDAFQLPLDINYPGDPDWFTSHVESELIYRRNGSERTPISLTFFGYGKFTPLKVKEIPRAFVVVPTVKLTVMQPSYEVVDVSTQQLAVAKKAAKAFITAMNAEKDRSEGAANKAWEKSISDFEKSLVTQSKCNASGFKLTKPWAKDGMQVETLEYQADNKKDGFGLLKSQSTYLLDDQGKQVAQSSVSTTTSYKHERNVEPQNYRVTTEVKTGDGKTLTSWSEYYSLSGELCSNQDSDGNSTRFQSAHGLPASISIFPGTDKAPRYSMKYSLTPVANKRFNRDIKDEVAGKLTRLVLDELGREVECLVGSSETSLIKLSDLAYDGRGRLSSRNEYDYDGSGDKYCTRTTTVTYDDSSNKCTLSCVLKDKNDKELDKKSRVVENTSEGVSITSNDFKVTRTYDAATATFVEKRSSKGVVLAEMHSVTRRDGNLESVKYYSMEKGGKVEQDSVSNLYTAAGLPEKVTSKYGGESTVSYDRFGRPLTFSLGELEVSNEYPKWNLSNVATSGSIKNASGTTVLGSQAVDGLGRVVSETLNGQTTTFTYEGTSRWGTRSSGSGAPATVAGYTAEQDHAKLVYSETHTSGSVTRKTTSSFSKRGFLIGFEGLLGGKTTLSYDALGRVCKSVNEHHESSFVYDDAGLLIKETIKSVKKKVTLTVTYQYNNLGHEVSRTFECPGFDKHAIERELLGDGRLSKSTLKVKDAERRSDSYEYDSSNRLKTWSCTGEGALSDSGKCYVAQEFDYDAMGDVVARKNKFYKGSSRPASLESYTSNYTFDASKPGAMITSGGDKMTEDAMGRLITRAYRNIKYHGNSQVKTYSASADGKGDDYSFSYDNLGRVRGGSVGTCSDFYHYRNNRVYALVQTDSAKKLGFSQRVLAIQNESPSCLMQSVLTTADKETESFTFELTDSQGSVFASLDLQTNKVTYYVYSPFGFRCQDPTGVTWLGFKGEPLHRLGLYHLGRGYRLYDPQLHRFQTPDNRSPFAEGGISRYAYCSSDPVNYQDPSGHQQVAQFRQYTPSLGFSEIFGLTLSVVGVLAAPFTGGGSLALSIAVTGLAATALAFESASLAIRHSDPQLSRTLGYVGVGIGLASAFAGIAATVATKVGGAFKSINSSLRSNIRVSVDRMNPAVLSRQHLKFGVGAADFELYGSGTSHRLIIDAHGASVVNAPVNGVSHPHYFSTGIAPRVGFYADPGIRVSMLNRSYPGIIDGTYLPANYYDSLGKIPNYFLSEMSVSELIKEMPQLQGKAPEVILGALSDLAATSHVDYVRPLRLTTLENILTTLENNGYKYSVVDGLFCRGTAPSSISGMAREEIFNFHQTNDFLNGALMTI
ncbi:RHS repeat-associated core domain-containing protein [Pseudomonas japonica]|uniref:RHS repeat-associated core domain-containing protein n=1 Tax=Pseudomonas japonica TaxID=256466 RepID=UPI0037FA9421